MDSGIFSYIRAFGVRWFVTMSGPLSVPLAVIAYFVQNDAAKVILFTTALLCGVFASYWVWKVEREARIKAENEINNRENRKNIRIALSRFYQEGQALRLRCEKEIDDPPPNGDATLWAGKTEVFICNQLDESWIVRFRANSDVQAVTPLPQPPRDHYHLWGWIHNRLNNLNEFIKELSHD